MILRLPAVVIEHGGSGSRVAAPIAKEIIDYYLVERLNLINREKPKEEPVLINAQL